MSGKNAQLGNQFPDLVKTTGAVKNFHLKNTLVNAKSQYYFRAQTHSLGIIVHITLEKDLYSQVPCQASVVVISAFETCLAVKFKKKS